MKLKQMLFWQWKTNRIAFLVFYLIVAAVTFIFSAFFSGLHPNQATMIGDSSGISVILIGTGSGSFNMATLPIAVIFLFILGLASFGENIRIALANSVSRRTHFISFFLFALAGAAVTAFLSILFDAVPHLWGTSAASSQFSGSFDVLLLFFFTVYLFAISLGYFIAGAFYRMGNPARVIVAVGVPVGIIALLVYINARFSTVDNMFPAPHDPLVSFLRNFGDWMTTTQNAALFFVCIAVLFLFFGWLVTRRAPVKERAE